MWFSCFNVAEMMQFLFSLVIFFLLASVFVLKVVYSLYHHISLLRQVVCYPLCFMLIQ